MNIEITPEYDGMTVFDLLRKRMHISCGTLTLLKNSPTGMTVDGVRVTVRHRLRAGERLSLDLADKPETGTSQIIPKKLPLPIIYEDDDIIVADKPAGMPTHPTHGHLDDTLANALAWRAERRGEPFVFRPANRLDRNTSGIVLLAKNRLASSRLYEDMKSGRIHKTYAAITVGVPDPQCEGRIDAQSTHGKVVGGVARRAHARGVPVFAIVGDVGDDAYGAYDVGVSAIFSINRLAVPRDEAKARSHIDYTHTLDDLLRCIRAAEQFKR